MAEGMLETILATVQEINDKLDAGGAASKDDKKPASGGKKKKISAEELTALVQPMVQDADMKPKVKDVLTSFGLKRLGEASEDQRAALFDAFTKLAEEEGSTDEDDDDGLLD